MKRAIIIGAGPAGLTAALELLRQGGDYEVVILEQSDEIGGISRTVRFDGNRMDIGGHRFFSKDERVMQWWADLMPMQGAPSFDDALLGREKALAPGGPDPETEDEVLLLRRRISRIYYGQKFFDYPISMKWQTLHNLGLVKTMGAGFSYLASAVHKQDEKTLEDFYINRFGKVLYGMFFEGYTEKLWGRHPNALSPDWGAQRVKGLSIFAVLKDMLGKMLPKSDAKKREVETSLIEEFIYPKFGPGQLWECAAQNILAKGGQLHKNCRVCAVTAQDGRVTGVQYIQDGETRALQADVVISSMPLRDLVQSLGECVPAQPAAIAAGLPYRDFVTVGLLLNKLNLKNETDIKTLNNIIPDCWIYVQDVGVKLGRIQVFNNWSPYLVADPLHTVWVGLEYFCQEGDDFWSMPEAECVTRAKAELIEMGVITPDTEILRSHRERVQKAYPSYFDTYEQIDDLIAYLNTYENLYCIGRNGQHRYNNMDHSMVTAFETVEHLLHGGDKAKIWDVNTDQQYHEKKEA